MTLRILAKPIATADNSLTAPGVYQKVTMASDKQVVAVMAAVVQYSNPTYTGIQMLVFADRAGSPGKLIATSSNTVLKATIDEGVAHALKSVYFEFTPKIALDAGSSYHFAMYITGAYVGDSTTHIGWKTTHPDPIFKPGVTLLQTKAAKMPYELLLVGANV